MPAVWSVKVPTSSVAFGTPVYTAPFTPPPLDAAPAFLHYYTRMNGTGGGRTEEAGIGSGYFFVGVILLHMACGVRVWIVGYFTLNEFLCFYNPGIKVISGFCDLRWGSASIRLICVRCGRLICDEWVGFLRF